MSIDSGKLTEIEDSVLKSANERGRIIVKNDTSKKAIVADGLYVRGILERTSISSKSIVYTIK